MRARYTRTQRSRFNITLADMTYGEALAVCNALAKHTKMSAICDDVRQALLHVVAEEGQTDEDQAILDALRAGGQQ
jgi:hypothetical protein